MLQPVLALELAVLVEERQPVDGRVDEVVRVGGHLLDAAHQLQVAELALHQLLGQQVLRLLLVQRVRLVQHPLHHVCRQTGVRGEVIMSADKPEVRGRSEGRW